MKQYILCYWQGGDLGKWKKTLIVGSFIDVMAEKGKAEVDGYFYKVFDVDHLRHGLPETKEPKRGSL